MQPYIQDVPLNLTAILCKTTIANKTVDITKQPRNSRKPDKRCVHSQIMRFFKRCLQHEGSKGTETSKSSTSVQAVGSSGVCWSRVSRRGSGADRCGRNGSSWAGNNGAVETSRIDGCCCEGGRADRGNSDRNDRATGGIACQTRASGAVHDRRGTRASGYQRSSRSGWTCQTYVMVISSVE